jgi:hypothetical protein
MYNPILDVTEDVEVLIDSDSDIYEHLCDCGCSFGPDTLMCAGGVYCSTICAYRFTH